nr:DUF4215 domain-containing protein [Pyxidicoccus fallax]
MKCAASQDVCIRNDCGDGDIQFQFDEVCDDGNIIDGDGCSHDCKSEEVCGNGIVDTAALEKCDDGNEEDGDGCSADCKSDELCGNRIIDVGVDEMCDDGNEEDGDGCSADCLSNEICGNNVVDYDEGCDDGNHVDGDGCSADCRSDEVCGNEVVDDNEVCDDGNEESGDGCSANCQSKELCGNGIVDVKEACDDGNEVSKDGCSADCRLEVGCGNSVLNPGEECDDGNSSNEDDCLSSCVLATCGDGYEDQFGPETEECDDGNALACGTCSKDCQTDQESSVATGSIKTIPGNQISDGEVFSISDGRIRLFFEFNKIFGAHGAHIPVGISDVTSASGVATAVEKAIQSVSSEDASEAGKLNLVARVEPAESDVVYLENATPGTHGNQLIIESVNDQEFQVTSMSDGGGHDCPKDTACSADDDCAGDGHGGMGVCEKRGQQRVGQCIISRPRN